MKDKDEFIKKVEAGDPTQVGYMSQVDDNRKLRTNEYRTMLYYICDALNGGG